MTLEERISTIESQDAAVKAKAIAESGLFDQEHYETKNGLSFSNEFEAIKHYLELGWALHLDPSRFFDTSFYLSSNPDIILSRANPLLHYILFGLAEGRKPSADGLVGKNAEEAAGLEVDGGGASDQDLYLNTNELDDDVSLIEESFLFDLRYYEDESSCDFQSEVSAIRHYLIRGWRSNLNPSSLFDGSFYLSSYPDVASARLNPFLHYLRSGRSEGRKPRLSIAPLERKPKAPADDAWVELSQKLDTPGKVDRAEYKVDIIIPVYRGYNDTLACIYSVLTSRSRTAFRLVVIDDCSPDGFLSRKLEDLAALNLITLIKNASNLGFVGSVNRGMLLSVDKDVILLNSDTLVYNDWIDRLRRHAMETPDVATVTPLSNNATIFSYPYFNMSNKQCFEMPLSELDLLVSDAHKDAVAFDVPTGVGFCFYITRKSLDVLGLFNGDLFGRGYGEENDYCFRAMEAGFRNLAAPNVFVRHTGEVSFGADSDPGKLAGGRQLVQVHPRYDEVIRDCIRRDPFKNTRVSIDVERFARWSGGRGILFIEHGWGGGIDRHISDMEALLLADGIPTLRMKPSSDGAGLAVASASGYDFPNLPHVGWNKLGQVTHLLGQLNLSRVHIHSMVGIDLEYFSLLKAAILNAGLEYTITLHDYTPVCPRITMLDWSGTYCDSPNADYCEICVGKAGSPFGAVDVKRWRREYEEVLKDASSVIAPSSDIADRISALTPSLKGKVTVRPHPYTRGFMPSDIALPKTPNMIVGVVGAIGTHKGSKILNLLAVDAQRRHLPMEFIIYGYTDHGVLADLPNVHITGAYREEEIDDMLRSDPCDVLLYCSVCPETFCFTLDISFRAGIVPVAFDIGAPSSRIKESGFGKLLPLEMIYDPASLNDEILKLLDRGAERRFVFESDRVWLGASRYYACDQGQPRKL